MWTVVYVAQKAQEIFEVKSILDDNEIISRIRPGNSSSEEEGTCYELLVTAGELSLAQDLILDFKM